MSKGDSTEKGTDHTLMSTLAALGLRHENTLHLLSAISGITAVPLKAYTIKDAGQAILEILTRELGDVANCSLMIHNPKEDRLELLAACGPADLLGLTRSYHEDLVFQPGRGVAGRAFEDNRPEFWNRRTDEIEALEQAPGMTVPESLASLPLAMAERVIGVLNVSFLKSEPFDHPRRRDLIILAGVVTNILQAISLKAEVDARVDESRREIIERKKTQEALSLSLREKEALLNEIHHRVKNNMQVVSSLLSLQAKKIQDQRVSEAFEVGQTRVMAMALIHEILYQSASLADIDMERYVTKLSDGLFRGYGADRHRITLKVRSDVIDLGLDYAVPFGLVVNELVSNAFKHAFPGHRTGEISIDAQKTGEKGVLLVVADNGVGIPPDMDLHAQRGLGLQLVTGLVENQLNGTLDLDRSEGTKFTIAFELGQYKSRI